MLLSTQKQSVEFDEFSIEAPFASSFMNMTPEDDLTVREMYRCTSEDLTITSFDKTYIENEYYAQNGEKINYTEGLLNQLKNDSDDFSKLSDNLTLIVQTMNIDGYADADIAAVYHDDSHVIIVEGGDVGFITDTAKSIKIL